ncbi:hypothetical protein PGTUg99_013493 [Puccinia graminis f. sp. tritici]|uniref:SET domain-containing protein n=1 Tax=Puccinia graminis f. sp. tritici TaxID=56615 RepID=A0A5B0S560_PUCGR|nr:hypothetical protein PGTUg99_013493 [Puccinia graminis f. sp. tritici]
MSSHRNRVNEFFNWTNTQQAHLHPQLRLRTTTTTTTITTNKQQDYSIELCPSEQQLDIIPKDTTVASIPKRACFSHRTSSLTNLDLSLLSSLPIDQQPVIRLTIHLIHELSLGTHSPWHPYLDLLSHPEHHQPRLIHLQVDEQPEIQRWLCGTEIERLLKAGRIISLARLHEIHENLAKTSVWETFLMAFTIVSSRAFQIDHFHHLALVPIADLFDHSDQPDVEMVSEPFVCDQCGAVDECIHDSKNLIQPIETTPSINQDTIDMVTIHPLVPPTLDQLQVSNPSSEHEEEPLPTVYNTYGKLPNARLLAEYGFMIDGNTHDKLHFDLDEVKIGGAETEGKAVGAVLGRLMGIGVLDNRVYDELVCELSEDTSLRDLSMDSNARLSPHLWLTIVFESYHPTPKCPILSAEIVTRLLALQSSISFHLHHSASLPPMDSSETDLWAHLVRIASLVQKVCAKRLGRYFLSEKSIDELLTLKESLLIDYEDPENIEEEKHDPLPSTQQVTSPGRSIPKETKEKAETKQEARGGGRIQVGGRKEKRETLAMAIEYVCSERILLNTCISLWNELEDALSPFTSSAS